MLFRSSRETLVAVHQRQPTTGLPPDEAEIVDYVRGVVDVFVQLSRRDGRRISTAMAESVMNHLINRRLSKRQQMRWSMKGAHCVLQVRVEMLDGRLERHFREHFSHFRSPERM